MNIMAATMITVAVSCALFVGPHKAAAASPADPASAIVGSLGDSAISTKQLSTMRGGALVISSQNIGTDSGNSANNTVTGSIIDNHSINGNTGITTIFQNTGNNTLFQASTTVNISIQ